MTLSDNSVVVVVVVIVIGRGGIGVGIGSSQKDVDFLVEEFFLVVGGVGLVFFPAVRVGLETTWIGLEYTNGENWFVKMSVKRKRTRKYVFA